VVLPDNININHLLVKEGWCWWYLKYAPGDTILEGLEKEAREVKKGVWQDRAPTPPWEYRKARRLKTEPWERRMAGQHFQGSY
jgi:micrococcal nuclease